MHFSVNNNLNDDINTLIKQHKGGVAIATYMTEFNEDIIKKKLSPYKSLNIALCAVGGFGRRELAPFSDVDIAIIARQRDADSLQQAKEVLYSLWDTGLNISHSFRTLKESLDDSFNDITVRTAYFNCRFIYGDKTLFTMFMSDVYQKLVFKNRRDFYKMLTNEINNRHKRYGDSVYMLEPNIKEGRGGLRDIHCILWLAKSFYRSDSIDEMTGLVDTNKLKNAYSFLIKIRTILHLAAKAKLERLAFDYHADVAKIFGYKSTKTFSAPEIMMKNYYKNTLIVRECLDKILSHTAKNYFIITKSIFYRLIGNSFYISMNEIFITQNYIDAPQKVFEAFYIFSSTGKRFHYSARQILMQYSRSLYGKVYADNRILFYFNKILHGNRVYETIAEMHYTHCLDLLFPEFARLRALVIYEPYHIYTVDEHTLLALKSAEELYHNLQSLHTLFKDKKHILYLSVLLHDIGKGISGKRYNRHEDEGYLMIKGIVERLALSVEDKRLIRFLVRNHLYFSKLVFSRDINAPETICASAEVVQDHLRLSLLYALTYSDMTAVSPNFFTEWKKVSLERVYYKTLSYLEGNDITVKIDSRLYDFANRFPLSYRLAGDTKRIENDCMLFETFDGSTPILSVNIVGNSAEITIISKDRPGLFLYIISVFLKRMLNVFSARLYMSNDGLILLNRFRISNWKEIYWDGLEAELTDEIKSAILNNTVFDCPVRSTSVVSSFLFENVVEIDNELSDEFTIIEFFTTDRMGLLFDVAKRFCEAGFNIHSAIINTEGAVVNDIFYVNKHTGREILKIALALHEAISLT